MTPDEEAVRERLHAVRDPDLDDSVAELGLINEIDIDHDTEEIHVDFAFGAPYSPTETGMAGEARDALEDLAYEVELSATIPDRETTDTPLPNVSNIVAVASGKGGVGKSTVAVNLAAGLSEMGARVGLFDADIYGPNVPRLVDAENRPQATTQETIVPPEEFGVKLMSMDFLVGDEDPVIWRGPMVHKAITQLFEDVEWGHLDYMVVDLPPGTGDTQLSLLQTVPVSGAVIVTTPQEVALDDARKGLEMFGEHETPVLGIVENMSGFRCPDCGGEHDIFGSGGGKEFAEEAEMPFLGELPLDPAVRESGDDGRPSVLGDGETAEAFRAFVRTAADMQGVVHRNRVRA